jgi:hypothetical protein
MALKGTLGRFWLVGCATVIVLALFGVGAKPAAALQWGQQWSGSFADLASPTEWEALDRSGASMIRIHGSWKLVQQAGQEHASAEELNKVKEPWETPAAWKYTYDPIFRLAAEHELEVLTYLYARKIAAAEKQFYLYEGAEKEAWNEWLKFVWTFVQRYGRGGYFWDANGDLSGGRYRPGVIWEVWNEPNLPENNPGGTVLPQKYAEFLIANSNTITSAQNEVRNPGEPNDTVVVHGGLIQYDMGKWTVGEFLSKEILVSGFSNSFGGLGIHPYWLSGTEGEKLAGVIQNVENARNALNVYGLSAKSLWITELGWPVAGTGKPTSTEDEQKKLLTQSFNWIASKNVAFNIRYTAWYASKDISDPNWAYHSGLRDRDGNFRPSWWAYQAVTGAAHWPAVTRSLYGTMMNHTGSGKTEVHVLDPASEYSTASVATGTELGETTASQWQFSFADYNGDRVADLIGVLMNGTGSGKTEVHIYDGANYYQTSLLHAVTGLGETTSSQWQFTTGDYNGDGKPDLIGVLMNGTGSGKTEVHILNGATGYSGSTLLSVATGLGETASSQWQFAAGDYNGDGVPDLIGVLMKGTGSGKTEVHIFSGASPSYYSTALLAIGTGLEETKPQQWQFSSADYNADGKADLLGVLMNGAGSSKTEAHILSGASNYTEFLVHAGTALGETTASQWQFSGAHVSGDWHPVATTEPATGISTEGATLNGAVNPQGISTTYHFDYGTTTSYGSSTPESGSIGNGTNSVAVSRAISGLLPSTTYHFRVVATNLEGTSYGQDRTFSTVASGTAGQLSGMAITEPFNGSSGSLANFNANWAALGWASGTTPKGSDTTTGWRPVDAFPTVNGAFFSPTITDTGPGIATVATMAANPGNAERHLSLWLDLQSPAGAKAGYELRFTNVSSGVYNVTLAKWQGGTETVLASKSSYAFANGNSFALLDQGGTVSAWTNTGSGFNQLLSAGDASFSGGNAGIQGAGNITRLTNFKVGALLSPVANMDSALKGLPVNDAFATNENPLSGGGAWAALAWDNSVSGHNTGWVSGGWGPYDAFSTINGAYWQKASFADSGAGDAVAALLYGNPTIASRYFSLWLNTPSPASARSGYELRFTETSSNVYEVALSKWQSGVKTVLASKAGYSFPTGSQFALADKAGTVSVWTKTGSEYTQLLSAADSTFINGYTGIEGSGNITRLKDFRSGPLPPF